VYRWYHLELSLAVAHAMFAASPEIGKELLRRTKATYKLEVSQLCFVFVVTVVLVWGVCVCVACTGRHVT
jgi:hypothetical protein